MAKKQNKNKTSLRKLNKKPADKAPDSFFSNSYESFKSVIVKGFAIFDLIMYVFQFILKAVTTRLLLIVFIFTLLITPAIAPPVLLPLDGTTASASSTFGFYGFAADNPIDYPVSDADLPTPYTTNYYFNMGKSYCH